MRDISLTIVIPLYNNVDSLLKALNSIANQSIDRWSCIIIDDGSTDGSRELVRDKFGLDRRFVALCRDDYTDVKGANTCRNIGLNKTTSKHVMFMDADDFLHIHCLRDRLKIVDKAPSSDMYIFSTAFVNNEENIIGRFHNPINDISDIIYRLVKHQIPWHTMSPVWSADFIKGVGGWNEDYERLQDVELNIRALLARPDIVFAQQEIDSFYHFSPMSEDKKRKAKMGFTRLVRDYYDILITSFLIKDNVKIGIANEFQRTLEAQFTSYINNDQPRDMQWEELYIKTLAILDIDPEDQELVKKIFLKL